MELKHGLKEVNAPSVLVREQLTWSPWLQSGKLYCFLYGQTISRAVTSFHTFIDLAQMNQTRLDPDYSVTSEARQESAVQWSKNLTISSYLQLQK